MPGGLFGFAHQTLINALQGLALPVPLANGFLKRTADATAWEFVSYGSMANTVAQGNDSRLTDSRAPTGSASGVLTGTYPNPGLAATAVSPATYGDATHVGQFTVGADGRLTAASNVLISGGSPSTPDQVRVTSSSPPLVTNATFTTLSWDTERFDSNTLWAAGNPTRLTCKTAGLYLLTGSIKWDANATGTRFLGIALNGTAEYLTAVWGPPISGNPTHQSIATLWQLALTDYVELQCYQNSGGNLQVYSPNAYGAEFGMSKIG
jgi:hypothetical protein